MKLYVIAGEASGDLHGAKLIEQLKALSTSPLEIYGVGGTKIKNTGALSFFDLAHFHATGFTDAIKKIAQYKSAFTKILNDIQKVRPDLVILIDNPGFNLRLAERIHKLQIPMMYYIAPQLWAWNENRIHAMKKLMRKVLVVFKFEVALYEKHGIPVAFVGHPLKDFILESPRRREARRTGPDAPRMISLLPGSRTGELKMLLNVFLDAALRIRQQMPYVTFQIIQAPTLPWENYGRAISKRGLSVRVIDKNSYDAIAQSDLALVCSGTATLECALLKVPMVIAYKTSALTYTLAKRLIKVPYLGMPNLILGERKFPELIQHEATPEKIAREAMIILKNSELRQRMIRDLEEMSRRLGEPGASLRAAREILEQKD